MFQSQVCLGLGFNKIGKIGLQEKIFYLFYDLWPFVWSLTANHLSFTCNTTDHLPTLFYVPPSTVGGSSALLTSSNTDTMQTPFVHPYERPHTHMIRIRWSYCEYSWRLLQEKFKLRNLEICNCKRPINGGAEELHECFGSININDKVYLLLVLIQDES